MFLATNLKLTSSHAAMIHTEHSDTQYIQTIKLHRYGVDSLN